VCSSTECLISIPTGRVSQSGEDRPQPGGPLSGRIFFIPPASHLYIYPGCHQGKEWDVQFHYGRPAHLQGRHPAAVDEKCRPAGTGAGKPADHSDQGAVRCFNISDLFEEKREEIPFKVRRITIKNGQVSFADRWITPEGLTTSLEKLDLRLDHPERGKTAAFKFSATVVDEGKTDRLP